MGLNGKDSVATQWARMVADAERGEVVAIANKHGKDVAVMISMERWHQLTMGHSHLWSWSSTSGASDTPPPSAFCSCGMTYGYYLKKIEDEKVED